MEGQRYRGGNIRAVALHVNIVELGGVDLDIRAHLAKVESVLIITLILITAPRKTVIPCVVVVVKFLRVLNSGMELTDVVSNYVDWATNVKIASESDLRCGRNGTTFYQRLRKRTRLPHLK